MHYPTHIIDSPIGKIRLHSKDNQLIRLEFLPENFSLPANCNPPERNAMTEAFSYYFENPKHVFQLNIAIKGTDFQKRVWEALRNIPPGETKTYGELARLLQTGPRAIGQACRTNPIPIIVPCHRIVASVGFGGYSGEIQGPWMRIKKWLLAHEGVLRLSA
ncbi:MAG: methylated-DNA--[protein]-cysteine S-methyltransferase [Gammaproteobacteria bacterium]|nr:methylated-DNA--[protein]-cysteine S-methyltransferase [Gammaproteobacteria bacterium]